MKNKFIKSLMNSLNSREREREREREVFRGFFMKKESNGIGENKNSKKISKNNKIISSILAIVMCCQPLVGAVPLNTDDKVNIAGPPINDNIDSENDLKDSEGEDEGDNKDFSEEEKEEDSRKSKGILEKIKDNYFKLAVGGLGLGALYGVVSLFRKLNNDDVEKPTGSGVGSFAGNFKVFLVGGQEVGKTGFANVLCDRPFSENYVSTIGAELKFRRNCVEGKEIILRIWDISGREKYCLLLPDYFGGARVICVCFDLNKKNGGHTNENETINSYLHYWVYLVREHCSEDTKFMFIGCKSDLNINIEDNEIENAISDLELNDKIIKTSDGKSFFKTSAARKRGIQEVLDAIS
ncbi:MAG: rab family small GTPase [Candidatus Improbicoccus pseudotrichonymphae]|uniref:Rab family small GTPase n=1 Tax=Candidatus Improbicoccus pseudotrichonymphae TaxID=3033792 RepID=A0AA48I1F6_9FIRM|nr:MAG: rab family small GTPase [Candidatus Improbicoccus pseudotrichonymphae]